MGLKASLKLSLSCHSSELKSDQDGIESPWREGVEGGGALLKSDQDGIERKYIRQNN